MKKTILVMFTAIFLAACNNGKGDASKGTEQPAADSENQSETMTRLNDMTSVAISYDKARGMVDKYRQAAGVVKFPKSYQLNANALRQYLNTNKDVTQLALFMAINDSGYTMVFIGAKDSTIFNKEKKDSITGYAIVPFFLPSDTARSVPMVFNHGMPCPQCDRINFVPNSKANEQK